MSWHATNPPTCRYTSKPFDDQAGDYCGRPAVARLQAASWRSSLDLCPDHLAYCERVFLAINRPFTVEEFATDGTQHQTTDRRPDA